ncbi:MAG: hypothetical protein QM496_01405 [Verrucomicrobiota bacterium]
MMSGKNDPEIVSVSRGRLTLGVVIFVLSIVVPLLGIPVVMGSGLSVAMKSTVSGVLLVGAEVLGIVAIAVMGKPGYIFIKNNIFGFLKRHGPPREVSRLRYRIGLLLFCLPLLFAWLSVYAANHIPGYSQNPLPYAIVGDALLLTSLFVLGGDFWDKIRALFISDAKVHFSGK